MSPEAIQQLLATGFVIVFVPTWLVAMSYVFILGRFFKEVKAKEPDTWEQIGRPGLLDMLCLPFLRFHKYTSFLPHLIERKNNPALGYRWAKPTYYLLVTGLTLFMLLVCLIVAAIVLVGPELT